MEKDVRREEIVIEEKVQHNVSGPSEMTVGQSESAESAAKVYIHKGGKGWIYMF